MKPKFIKYRSNEIVEACDYEPGMEDGFETWYYDDDDKKNGNITAHQQQMDRKHTILIPYILDDAQNKILTGEGHMLVKHEDGRVESMLKTDFEIKYERKNKTQ